MIWVKRTYVCDIVHLPRLIYKLRSVSRGCACEYSSMKERLTQTYIHIEEGLNSIWHTFVLILVSIWLEVCKRPKLLGAVNFSMVALQTKKTKQTIFITKSCDNRPFVYLFTFSLHWFVLLHNCTNDFQRIERKQSLLHLYFDELRKCRYNEVIKLPWNGKKNHYILNVQRVNFCRFTIVITITVTVIIHIIIIIITKKKKNRH